MKFLSHPRVETRISHTAKNRNCTVSLVRNKFSVHSYNDKKFYVKLCTAVVNVLIFFYQHIIIHVYVVWGGGCDTFMGQHFWVSCIEMKVVLLTGNYSQLKDLFDFT